MSESQSDTSATAEASASATAGANALYPYEGKYKSAAEKAEMQSLSEVRREEILAERAQEKERRHQDLTLQNLIANRDRTEAKEAKKRKGGAVDIEDTTQRKSTRQKRNLGGRQVGESSAAIEAYKREREERNARGEAKRRADELRARDGPRPRSRDNFSDADADGESDLDFDDRDKRRGSPTPPREEPPVTLEEYNRIRVARVNFAQYFYYPTFEKLIPGAFVRVAIGFDQKRNRVEYRMAEIKGFVAGKPYAIENANGKSVVMSHYLVCSQGKISREFPFIHCSSDKFTPEELNVYKAKMANDNLKLHSRHYLLSKIDDINKVINHQFTEEELQEKLRRSGALENRSAEFKRIDITRRREEAVYREDEAEVAKCDAELQALGGPRLAFGTSLSQPKPVVNKGPSEQDRIAARNKLVRKQNAESVRRAQLAEKKARQQHQKLVERGEALPNPFARVQTIAKTHYDDQKKLQPPKSSQGIDDLFDSGASAGPSRTATPLNGAGTPKVKPTTAPASSNGTPKSSSLTGDNISRAKPLVTGRMNGVFMAQPTDDEILAALDIDIEIPEL